MLDFIVKFPTPGKQHDMMFQSSHPTGADGSLNCSELEDETRCGGWNAKDRPEGGRDCRGGRSEREGGRARGASPPTGAGRLTGALSNLKSPRFDCVHGRSNSSVMRQFGGW